MNSGMVFSVFLLVLGLIVGVVLGYWIWSSSFSSEGQALAVIPGGSGKLASVPFQDMPDSVLQWLQQSSEVSGDPVLREQLAVAVMEDALQNNATFWLDNRSFSAKELRENPALRSMVKNQLVFAFAGDTGGVDAPALIDQALRAPLEPVSQENRWCQKETVLIPCVYRQYAFVSKNNEAVSVHVLGGCPQDIAAWKSAAAPVPAGFTFCTN